MPQLREDEIHVWSAPLDRACREGDALAGALSRDERSRAARFHFERDRDRFVVARGLLRLLLGGYLGVQPKEIRFAYGEFGKPALASANGVSFNLAHADGRALYAFGLHRDLGVDTECLTIKVDHSIAEHYFAPAEVATLRSLPVPLQPKAFLNCWTRKEAFVKARGDGLSLPLSDFEVTLAPGEPAALIRTAWSEDEPRTWTLCDLSSLCPGFVSALATDRGSRIIAHEYPASAGTYEGKEHT